MSYDITQLPVLPFFWTHAKTYGVRGLIKHYRFQLEPKLGHENYEIRKILYACVACTNILDNLWENNWCRPRPTTVLPTCF